MKSNTKTPAHIYITKDVRTNEGVMYISEARTKFVPAFVFYILEYHECKRVSFNTSIKEYSIEVLKDKQTWKEVDDELKQTH